MRIAFLSGDVVKEKFTGPKNSITLLSKNLEKFDCKCKVYSLRNEPRYVFNDVMIYPYQEFDIRNYDCLVLSGVYFKDYIKILILARFNNVKVIISPRSSLMISSLNLKKKIFLHIIFTISKDVTFHFLTLDEKNNSIKVKRSFVSPNGLVSYEKLISNKTFNDKENVVFGFMGRLDVKHKGLKFIPKLLRKTNLELGKNFKFILCGPDFHNGKNEILEESKNLMVDRFIDIRNPLIDDFQKKNFFDEIDFFIHPSNYEGMPQSVMEAMGYGVPVIISDKCNLSSFVPNYLIHSYDIESMLDTYLKVSSMNDIDYDVMSKKLNAVSKDKFDWEKIAFEFIRKLKSL